MTSGCSASARSLLDFYVNGTLDRHERSLVRRHLRDCQTCTREVEEITEVHLLLAASTGAAPGRASKSRLPLAACAAVVLLMAAVSWWALRSVPWSSDGAALEIDLGAGALRGSEVRAIVVPEGAEAIDLVFPLTPERGARYAVRVIGPRAETRFGPEALSGWDEFGMSRLRVPSSCLRPSGRYGLEIIETGSDDGSSTSTYLFDVHE